MKNSFIRMSAFTALLLTSTALAEEAPIPTREQIQGKVRCVLMSVGQTTVFPNSDPNQPVHGDKQAVPCLTVTYLIERLGDEPFKTTALQEFQILSGGKPVKLVNYRSGTYTKTFNYEVFPTFLDFTKPPVGNPARSVILQHVEFGAVPNLQPFDLLIKSGFDEKVPTFRFPSIRLQ